MLSGVLTLTDVSTEPPAIASYNSGSPTTTLVPQEIFLPKFQLPEFAELSLQSWSGSLFTLLSSFFLLRDPRGVPNF